MSVNKGDRMTAAQMNALIDKINAEAARRGYSGRVAKVSQNAPIDYDTINAINLNRIEVAKIYRSGYWDAVGCVMRTDASGTPSVWDGRDLRNVVINPQEEVLARGKRAYASQYNLLEKDIDNMATMCKCNAYNQTITCSCQLNTCSCNYNSTGNHCDCNTVLDCECVTVLSCGCQTVIDCGCDSHFDKTTTCNCERQTCYSNCGCNTDGIFGCTCESQIMCSTNCGCVSVCLCQFVASCTCDYNYVCECNNNRICECVSNRVCNCNTVCSCNSHKDLSCSCVFVCSCDLVCTEYAK